MCLDFIFCLLSEYNSHVDVVLNARNSETISAVLIYLSGVAQLMGTTNFKIVPLYIGCFSGVASVACAEDSLV